MNKKTLYGVDKSGGVKQWSVWTDGGNVHVEHGKYLGKLQTKITKCKPKNVGKANETTIFEQSDLEAQSKWNKQYDKYYRETIEEADALLTEGVMLAQVVILVLSHLIPLVFVRMLVLILNIQIILF